MVSAIESLFTSHDPQHRTILVAKARIQWFLGPNTSVYPPGELTDFVLIRTSRIRNITADLYRIRNYIAHGDRLPDDDLRDVRRPGLGPEVVNLVDVLLETQSFIIRKSLMRILRDDLIDNFADAAAAESYFAAHNLTKEDIRAGHNPIP